MTDVAMRTPSSRAVALALLLLPLQALAAPTSGPRDPGQDAARQRLEAIRQDPHLASDPGAIEALARDAETFPTGQVRVDARMLVAMAWIERLHRPDDGIAELRRVVDDASADPVTSRFAEGQIVDTLLDEGRLDAAIAEAHARADRLDPRFVAQVDRLGRRRWARRAAFAIIVVFVAFASIALGGAARRGAFGAAARAFRGFAPLATLFVAYVGVAGGWLAASYESGNAAPFLLFGAAALPLLLLARGWAAVGSPASLARVFRAVVCAGAALAAAFVVLDALGLAYLQGFGL
jgi:hypothetical protein